MKYALLLLPILASCSTAAPTQETATTIPAARANVDAATLGAHHWQLRNAIDRDGKRIDALFARPQQPLQLDFGDGRLSVVNACNHIGGGYRIENEKLQLGQMMQTLMACTDPKLSRLDDAISQRLKDGPRISLQSGSSEPLLRLATAGGDTLDFAGVPTAQTRYGSEGETLFLEVDAQTAPCSHPLIRDMRCLKVRERRYDANGLATGTPGEWQFLYQDIEGYTHQAGTRNVLRVKRYAIAHPPADAPSQAYVLDLVVESERVER